MWLWIQNALSKKRQQFFFDILILVTCIHILSIVCAGIYQSKRAVEQISLVAPDASKSTLVFVPLCKKIEQPKTNSSANSLQKPHHMMNYDEFLERQKKAQAAPEKKLASPKSPQKKSEPKKPEVKKTVSKPAEKKVEPKKGATQKALSNKPLAATSIKTGSEKPKKAPVKKESALQTPSGKKAQEKAPAQKVASDKKQEVVVEKQVEKAVLEKPQEQEKEIVVEQKIADATPQQPEEVAQEIETQPIQEAQKDVIASQENVLPPIDMNDVTFVGIQDLEHLQVHQIVSGQLAKYWKRPVGMEKKMCVIKIELDTTGKIVNVLVEKSSGVPMYDMAAKAAAIKPIYPREIWNKKLVIQF